MADIGNITDFDEYLRQGEPGRREKAQRHIEGTATIDDVQRELRNRYLIINPPDEWKEPVTEQVPHKHPTSTGQVHDRQREYHATCICDGG